jgi:hypothetical protein
MAKQGRAAPVPGKGAVVKAISIYQVLSQLDFVMLTSEGALRDLFEVREATGSSSGRSRRCAPHKKGLV